MREWLKANEPSASTSVLMAPPSPYDFGDFNHFHIDADENYWIGGIDGWVVKIDFSGSIVWDTQLPVDAAVTDYVAGLFLVDGVGGIAFTEQSDGEYDWFHVDFDGTYSDITSSVTVDGVPWDSAGMGEFGDPNVVTTQYGNRIGFRKGSDFYIAVL